VPPPPPDGKGGSGGTGYGGDKTDPPAEDRPSEGGGPPTPPGDDDPPPGREPSNSPITRAIGPSDATSVPIPLLVLAGVAVLLMLAGAAGFVSRRLQSRRVPLPARAIPPAPRR